MSGLCLSQDLALAEAEDSAVLLSDVAVANFALAPWAQERGVRQDDPADDLGNLTRHHGRTPRPRSIHGAEPTGGRGLRFSGNGC